MSSPVKLVYETIRKRILNQEYVPSQTLVELSLAEEFGVSRNTVRKALMKLVNDKLIVMEANKSAVVKFLTKEEALNLFEIRERLEGLITYSAAKVIKKSHIKKIRAIMSDMEVLLESKDLIEYSEKNDIIHDIIDDVCPNKEAIELIKTIRLQLRGYTKRAILIAGRPEESFVEHVELIKHLELNDAEASENVMRRHMAQARKTLIDNYEILI